MDGLFNVLVITAVAIVAAVVIVTVPEIVSRHMINSRIRRATEALDSVTAAMEEFQASLAHMTQAVQSFSKAMDDSGLTRLIIEHHEKEIEDEPTNHRPTGEYA